MSSSSDAQRAFLRDLRRAYPNAASATLSDRALNQLSWAEAHQELTKIELHAERWPWRRMTKQSIVAEAAFDQARRFNRQEFTARNFDALELWLRPMLQTWRPLTFKSQGRPLPRETATTKLRQVMSMVAPTVTAMLQGQPLPEAQSQEREPEQVADEVMDSIISEPEPIKQPRRAKPSDAETLYQRIERLRDFARDRGLPSLDSMRVQLDAKRAFDAGCPANGIMASIMAEWSDDSIRQAGESRFDFAAWGADQREPGTHAVWPYVERLIKAGVPVYLHGPAGTGKSSAARQAAETLGLAYYELNLAGAMASAIRGRDTLQGFMETPFIHAYRDGGVLVMEEIDAAHPNVLTAINNAVANGHWANEAMDTVIARHADFRIVATANTLGTGATKDFSGRMRLDGATLDRFRVGRVHVELDKSLERSLLGF